MKKRKTTIAVVTGILLTTGALWAYMRSGPDPQLEKVKQMQAEMFKQGTRPDPAKLAELDEARKQLTPAQQQQLGRSGREQFERRLNETINTYFSLPKEKRTAFLDEKIKEAEKWRQARESNRGRGDSGGGNGGPGGGGASAGGQGGAGGPGGGAGGPGGQGGPGGPNTDQRAQRQLQRMDSMPATQRAQFQTFRADMNQRLIDQGLPPMTRRPLPPR